MYSFAERPLPSRSVIAKGALSSGAIDAVINGAIRWYLLSGQAPLPLTVDGIGSDERTVFGAAVPLAVSPSTILTALAYTTIKLPKPRFYPAVLWVTSKHGFFALGVVIAFAVLWQRVLGSILVPLPVAVVIPGLLSGIVAAAVNYMTIEESLQRTHQ